MLGLPMKTPGVCYKSTLTLYHISSAGKREEIMSNVSQQKQVKIRLGFKQMSVQMAVLISMKANRDTMYSIAVL